MPAARCQTRCAMSGVPACTTRTRSGSQISLRGYGLIVNILIFLYQATRPRLRRFAIDLRHDPHRGARTRWRRRLSWLPDWANLSHLLRSSTRTGCTC